MVNSKIRSSEAQAAETAASSACMATPGPRRDDYALNHQLELFPPVPPYTMPLHPRPSDVHRKRQWSSASAGSGAEVRAVDSPGAGPGTGAGTVGANAGAGAGAGDGPRSGLSLGAGAGVEIDTTRRAKPCVGSISSAFALELCCGSAGLAAQLRVLGIDALGVDWTRNPQRPKAPIMQADLASDSGQSLIWDIATSANLQYSHGSPMRDG
jgi:hypothetical protein